MGLPKGSSEREQKVDEAQESKIGTWISVGVVGGVILLTYFVLYGLYMARV
ncbi:hypothetical protein ACTWQL_01390 [Pseudalkalibacillus sp. R45]|uniref:hypothetical protein n=1 Tax=Pseudalkalibacillus sp. R45 TaxID=3457433 RepID=UPI003FCD4FBF